MKMKFYFEICLAFVFLQVILTTKQERTCQFVQPNKSTFCPGASSLCSITLYLTNSKKGEQSLQKKYFKK